MKIDFYILDTTSKQKAWLFACQLVEKKHAENPSLFIHMPSREEAERLDALLWTYRDDSFLPHQLYDASEQNPIGIQIGYDENQFSKQQLLFNLSQKIPSFYAQFDHIVEIVFTDTLVQQLARERYKQYRDSGHEINTIKLKVGEHDIN